MDAAYGGTGQALQYEATALFNFTTSGTETLYLGRLSDNFSGTGFDSLKLVVLVDGTSHTYSYSSLPSAETVFANNGGFDLGSFASGSQSVSLDYFLTYNSGTKATAGAGFAFAYDLLAYPTLSSPALENAAVALQPTVAIPETSTWIMMLAGLAGLGWFGSQRSSKGGKAHP
jgi:hypothetical protein